MRHRPWHNGKFLISAGLKPLGALPIFEPEENLEFYLQNKKQTRTEDLEKYYTPAVGLSTAEIDLIADQLENIFRRDLPQRQLAPVRGRDRIDAIISQVPEDFSVWKMQEGNEWLALIHLCAPNHWDAREKIGKNFFASHEPVPYIDAISAAAPKIFQQIQNRGAVERFAWGVATDNRLNHHPEAPRGRSFNQEQPELYIRMERQTVFPIAPELNGFTIKTYFINVATLSLEDLALIYQAIAGMDEAILKYKGLWEDREPILKWIDSLMILSKGTEHRLPHVDRPWEQSLSV